MDKITKYYIYLFLLFFTPLLIHKISLNILIIILLLTFVILFAKKFKLKKFPIYLFIISLIIRVGVVLLINTTPMSDFSVLYNASLSIVKHDYSFNNDLYFYYWAYQIGFVFMQSLFLKICNSILFLKILNAIVTSGICVLIYYIAKEFMHERYAKVVSIFYMLMIFPLTYVTVLTNQHMSTFLIYLAIYIIVSKNIKISELKRYLIVGILLSIANIIRPEGIIVIFSIILYLLLLLRRNNIKDTLKKIVVLLASYYLLLFVVSKLFIFTGIGPYGLTNNAPYWKFVLGFNHETVGRYTNDDTYVLGNREVANELIKTRVLTSPKKLIKLFINKSNIFWNTSTLDWSLIEFYDEDITLLNKSINVSSIAYRLNMYNQDCLFIMYSFVIIGVYTYIKKKDYNKSIILLINLVFVTFGVYLLIEIQPRYSYFIEISTVILMGLGIEYLVSKINILK